MRFRRHDIRQQSFAHICPQPRSQRPSLAVFAYCKRRTLQKPPWQRGYRWVRFQASYSFLHRRAGLEARANRQFRSLRAHFWLGLGTAMHLRMRLATPSVHFRPWRRARLGPAVHAPRLGAWTAGHETSVERDRENDCQEDHSWKQNYSSGDFEQKRTSAYNYNLRSVNCEQDWKLSGHYSTSVISSRQSWLCVI